MNRQFYSHDRTGIIKLNMGSRNRFKIFMIQRGCKKALRKTYSTLFICVTAGKNTAASKGLLLFV